MTLAVTYTRAQKGIDAPLVTVETHIAYGVPHFAIVGLAEKAVNESKDRVRSAILNSNFEFPPQPSWGNLEFFISHLLVNFQTSPVEIEKV